MNFKQIVLIGAAVIGSAACATSAVSPARMASAQAAIRAAGEVGATRTPSAALHLQYAREQYALAERLEHQGDNERAEMALLRAEADAELAVALARETAARSNAQQAQAQVQATQTQQ